MDPARITGNGISRTDQPVRERPASPSHLQCSPGSFPQCSHVPAVMVDVMSERVEVSVVIAFRVAKVLDASIYDVIAGRAYLL